MTIGKLKATSPVILVLSLLTCLILFFSQIITDPFTLVRLVNYASPFMMSLAIVLIVTNLLYRRYTLALLLMVTFSLSTLDAVSSITISNGTNDPNRFKILSYNTLGRNIDVQKILEVLEHTEFDIALLQEVTDGKDLVGQSVGLAARHGLTVSQSAGGNLIFSKYPVETKSSRLFQWASADVNGHEITLLNLHAPKAILDATLQNDFTETLVTRVLDTPGPVIVSGDFNTTPANSNYRKLARYLVNTHDAAGSGFGFTFPGPARRMGLLGPFLRIDHIFVSDHFDVLESRVLDETGGSDHYPVLATVVLKAQ